VPSSVVGPRHAYVHVPFCSRRCSYCDFAIAVRRVVPVDEYLTAVGRELALRFDHIGNEIETLYLGGGTPSRLGPDGLGRLVQLVASRFALTPGAEVTIEANPEDVTPDDARRWRDSGITRVSLGAQSFSNAALAWMHRTHDAAAIGRAVEAIRGAGFDDYSVDLIFALPSTVERDWTSDLQQALALEPSHVSLYGLTVEAHTPLGRWRDRGQITDAPEERYEHEYLEAHETLGQAGFDHYEVSNFGRPGHRARHNSSYWRAVPYVGLGPGAHEFDGETRRWNTGVYADWVSTLGEGRDPIQGSELLTAGNVAAESVYLGLRTTDGLALSDRERAHVQPWIDQGWAECSETRQLRLTALGWLRLDSLAADLAHFGSRS
jgi:oxygen-independent coproporphyrinogen-3 oxidase